MRSNQRSHLKEDHHEFLEIYFFTPTEFEKSAAAWPIRLGSNIAKPNYHIGPRVTPYYYLLFVLEGEGTFIQGNRSYSLRKNDMFCLFPQVTHEYFTKPDAPLHKAFFAFDGRQALHLLSRIGLKHHTPHIPNALTPAVIEKLWDFFDLSLNPQRRNTDLARLTVFYQIFDLLWTDREPTLRTDDKHSLSWLQKGLEYLEIHFTEGITIESVAEYVGVDRSHFTKTFQKAYGISPTKYVQQLKVNEASLLLKQTNYKLAEIAHSVGYPDLFSFSKAFKKSVGISPNQYRLQQRQMPSSDIL